VDPPIPNVRLGQQVVIPFKAHERNAYEQELSANWRANPVTSVAPIEIASYDIGARCMNSYISESYHGPSASLEIQMVGTTILVPWILNLTLDYLSALRLSHNREACYSQNSNKYLYDYLTAHYPTFLSSSSLVLLLLYIVINFNYHKIHIL